MKSIKLICAIFLLKIKMMLMSQNFQSTYTIDKDYDKNMRPSTLTDVSLSLYINRISAVDENKEEISFDVFLEVIWEDQRIKPKTELINSKHYIELTAEERYSIWIPDLYIRQLREMKVMKLFEEISSLRLYDNSTISFSIGATIIIKCDMDFVLYPLDVQRCPVDFSSYKYTTNDMRFHWKKDNPISFPDDSGVGFFRLPKYFVSFSTEKEPIIINYGDADHCSARLEITLSREVKSYLLENYLPSTLFVSMSWGSFVVVPEVVPGRMVLLVTTLLSLVTMFDTVRNNSPDALELKCIEVWLISCTLFVFLALIEYFIVLFGIRYDKSWRTVKNQIQTNSNVSVVPAQQSSTQSSTSTSEAQMTSMQSQQRKNGLEHATRMFSTGVNKISPENKAKEAHIAEEEITNIPTVHPANVIHRRRFRNIAEYAVLYAGSQRGKLDQISLVLFPLSFLLFSIVYWVLYIGESRKKMI